MKKFLKVLVAILFVGGFIVILGAAGDSDCGVTFSTVLRNGFIGLGMMLSGFGLMCVLH